MFIIRIDSDSIEFDNGTEITFDHKQDCCEHNYADFTQLERLALNEEFQEELDFEWVCGGFRFGNLLDTMFFVPCYSEQNGYYSDDVDIYYDNELVLTTRGERIGY